MRQDRAALGGCAVIMNAGCEADDTVVRCSDLADIYASSTQPAVLSSVIPHRLSSPCG